MEFGASVNQRLPIIFLEMFQATLPVVCTALMLRFTVRVMILLFTVLVRLPLTILDAVAQLCGAKNKCSWFRAEFAKYIKLLVECTVRQLFYTAKMIQNQRKCNDRNGTNANAIIGQWYAGLKLWISCVQQSRAICNVQKSPPVLIKLLHPQRQKFGTC